MKLLRIALIVTASLVLVLGIGVALAFTPAVQTWAAKKFAPASPELTVTIGRVSAGLEQTRLENVRVVQPGLVLTMPSVEVDVGVLGAIGGTVDVKRLVAKGWILDLTEPVVVPAQTSPQSKPSASSGAKEPQQPSPQVQVSQKQATSDAFNGIFDLLKLPVDLSVDGVDFSGDVIIPEGRAQVAIKGGDVAVGGAGKFALVLDVKTKNTETINLTGTFTARMETPRTFNSLSLVADVVAKGPQLPPAGVSLSLSLSATRPGASETYSAMVLSGNREILSAEVELPSGDAPLAGKWTLDATQADAAPFALGRPLPDFTAKGQGTFTADRMFTAIKAAGSLDATLDKLSAIQPEFAALGRLTLAAGFDVATQGDTVNLQKLDVRVAGAKPVLTVAALQVVSFNTATSAVTAADPSTDLLRITLDGLPLAWAKPFLGDLVLTGDDVRGAFTATARDGGFVLRPSAPITLTNLSVTQAGQPLVQALDVSLSAQADYSPKGFNAEVTNLSARSAGATILTLTAKAAQPAGDKQPLTATGTYEVNLPAALAQPVAAGSAALQGGVARGDFTASVADITTATLTLQLAQLTALDGTALPSVALTARADIDATGRIKADAPLVITQGKRRSDLTLAAVVTQTEKNTDIQAKLTSQYLHIPDLQLFAALSPAPAGPVATTPPVSTPKRPAPKTPPAPPAPAPTEPLWAGVTGELLLSLKSVAYSKDIVVNDVEGVVKITPAALTLQNLQAALKTGGNLKAGGGLQFDAKQKQPYALKADVALTAVEPAPILRALSPGKPSPVEGKFDLTTQLSGRATDPSAFDETVVGDITLASKGGTLKALNVKTSAAVDNVGKAAAIAGILGQLAGSESTMKYADRARAAADVTKQLGSLQFDQLNLVLARDEKNNMGIKDLSLISPIVRFAGSGTITYQPGVPLMQQPLLLSLQLAAKGKLGDDLRTLKLIDSKADTSNYAALVEKLTFDGSLQAVGTSQLSNLINRALTN